MIPKNDRLALGLDTSLGYCFGHIRYREERKEKKRKEKERKGKKS